MTDRSSSGTERIGLQRTECWRCGYDRLIYESCPECGGSCKPMNKRKQRKEDNPVTDGGTDRSPLTASTMDPENDEYATPPRIWRPLSRVVDGFDVDPASGAESTPIAPTRYTKEDDGLSKAWEGDVFLNPPWSTNGDGSAKVQWLRKARSEANRDAVNRVVMILPSDTGAHWFHEQVLAANSVCFVGPGRIPFQGADRNPSFALLIAVFGPVDDALADALDSLGEVVRGRSIYNPAPQTSLVPAADGENDRQDAAATERSDGGDDAE